MRVLVVGSGGREHALAWHLRRDGDLALVAPGNAGIPGSVAVQATNIEGLIDVARRERIDLTIVGPEVALAAGLVDAFAAHGLAAFGPTRAAARLEWSKAWAKEFFRRHGIPTAASEVVTSEAGAREAIEHVGLPVVLKADGLAAGKGVFVAHGQADVEAALEKLFRDQTFGAAAETVLVEECLEGPELSVLAFTDGVRFAVMPPARDYKRLRDHDLGPNTGGMGGYTWPGYATARLVDDIEERVFRPTLAGMLAEGQPYRGVLYAGLMLTRDGPRVLEFNCRFGDPECQLILPLLRSRLSDVCLSVVSGELRPDDISWNEGRTYGVVLAAPGYPEAPLSGSPIAGLDDVGEDVLVFHAGTRADGDGQLVTAGGRVLMVVASQRDAAYEAASTIRFDGKQFRRDIGLEPKTLTPPVPVSRGEKISSQDKPPVQDPVSQGILTQEPLLLDPHRPQGPASRWERGKEIPDPQISRSQASDPPASDPQVSGPLLAGPQVTGQQLSHPHMSAQGRGAL